MLFYVQQDTLLIKGYSIDIKSKKFVVNRSHFQAFFLVKPGLSTGTGDAIGIVPTSDTRSEPRTGWDVQSLNGTEYPPNSVHSRSFATILSPPTVPFGAVRY